MLPRRTRLLTALLLAASAPLASAHDTWLRPLAGQAAVGATVKLELTSGMAFPALESAIRRERVARADVRLGGTTTRITSFAAGKEALVLAAALPRPGVATIAVALAPRALELDEAQVAEYLEEIGLAATVLPEWRQRKTAQRWRETYRKLAKAFVRVGAPAADPSGLEPVGLPLELVPESDPTALATGASVSVRVLKDGAPLAGIAVAAVSTKGRRLATSDAAGRVSFALDAIGPWMFAATQLRPAAKGEWESDFTTMVVDVAGAPSR
jgi:uncharacterized GH25 family protein